MALPLYLCKEEITMYGDVTCAYNNYYRQDEFSKDAPLLLCIIKLGVEGCAMNRLMRSKVWTTDIARRAVASIPVQWRGIGAHPLCKIQVRFWFVFGRLNLYSSRLTAPPLMHYTYRSLLIYGAH
jgi:hypothetical protein